MSPTVAEDLNNIKNYLDDALVGFPLKAFDGLAVSTLAPIDVQDSYW